MSPHVFNQDCVKLRSRPPHPGWYRLFTSPAKPDAVRRTVAAEAMDMVSLRDKRETLSAHQGAHLVLEKSRIPTIFLGSHQQTWRFGLVCKKEGYIPCTGHAYFVLRNISSNIL